MTEVHTLDQQGSVKIEREGGEYTILMPNCVPICKITLHAQIVHCLFISYWVNIIVRIANVSFFTTFLIVLFHELNKLRPGLDGELFMRRWSGV